MLPDRLLGSMDPHPVFASTGEHPRLLVVADHAGRAIPYSLEKLGLADAALDWHIAYDIGAFDLATSIAQRFDARLVTSRYSRLVIDANRYPYDPASMPTVSDGTDIPGNVDIGPAERHRRTEEIFRPYHERISAELDALGDDVFFLSVHTMTDKPSLGPARAEEIAISWCDDASSAAAALAALRHDTGLTVGDNTPYAIDHGEDFTTPEHAVRRGLRHIQVEFRQDLVAERNGAEAWAARFAPALEAALNL